MQEKLAAAVVEVGNAEYSMGKVNGGTRKHIRSQRTCPYYREVEKNI